LPQLTLARAHVATGDPDTAGRLSATVTGNLQPSVSRDDADSRTTRIYCAALAGQARLAVNPETLWSEIVSTLSRNAGRQSPEGLVLLAEAEASLGRLEAARRITTQLSLAGYQHPDLSSLLQRYPGLGNLEVAARQ
jgi:hypothetical protein